MLGVFSSYGQEGVISGIILDAETGEELIGAAVYVPALSTGTVADIYGKYHLKLASGTYRLEVSYVSYNTQIIQDVSIRDGENITINISLTADVGTLEEIVVTAEQIKNDEVALLSIQKKSFAVQDGISSQEIKRLGVSNAAESMKGVTGAAIEDGKYVVMRGLGDRYSITQMNGITMPSADPYRNSTSMDLIPSDMIENIITAKTFTADQPGNFTGGKVDITTKSLPDGFYMNVGVSTSYNTQSSLINGFVTDGVDGEMDWLGYDNGSRDRPAIFDENDLRNANILAIQGRNPANIEQRNLVNESAKSLFHPFVFANESTPLNFGLDFSVGNQTEVFGKKFGYNFGANFSSDYLYYDQGVTGIYSDGGGEILIREQEFNQTKGSKNAQVGGLLSLSMQLSPNHEITLNNLYNHTGETTAVNDDGFWRNTGQPNYVTNGVFFIERGIYNGQLSGKHYFENFKNLKLEWLGGYTNATQKEPDSRIWAYITAPSSDGGTVYSLQQSEIGILPSHWWRALSDEQISGKLDVTFDLIKDKSHQLKLGGLYSDKQRDFSEFFYSQIQVPTNSFNPSYLTFGSAAGDFNSYFQPDNSGGVDTPESNGTGSFGFGNVFTDLTFPKNNYEGSEEISAAYLMGVFDLSPKWKLIGGARVETTKMGAVSQDPNEGIGDIDETDILPSMNVVYKLSDNTNLRAAATQTLARPNLREIAPFASTVTPGRPIFLGNPDLDRSLIQNFDLRYETYMRPGELFAVSLYHKHFDDPIIYLLTPKASTPEITPQNVDEAIVYGAEFEFRKSLDFISPSLESLKFSANMSLIYSKVDKSEEELEVLRNEQAQGKRLNIEDYRPFQGQSPYIVNVGLTHVSSKLLWENTISFNIWGERLAFQTGALDPDVYEQPRPSLNFVSNKEIGEKFSLKFRASNLLNMEYLKEFDFAESPIYESLQYGTTFSLGLTYNMR
jgi:TonB-dependent receptor